MKALVLLLLFGGEPIRSSEFVRGADPVRNPTPAEWRASERLVVIRRDGGVISLSMDDVEDLLDWAVAAKRRDEKRDGGR